MGQIAAFEFVSVDGFFAGPNGEIDFFKEIKPDAEWHEYSHQQASAAANTLLLGRITYEMMKSWWPTDMAIQMDPVMAKVMDESPKVVISKSLEPEQQEGNWKNVRILRSIARNEIEAIKESGGITILGSGTIVQQMTNFGLIDRYELVVVPTVLGAGKALFHGVSKQDFRLTKSRPFGNGIALLRYERA